MHRSYTAVLPEDLGLLLSLKKVESWQEGVDRPAMFLALLAFVLLRLNHSYGFTDPTRHNRSVVVRRKVTTVNTTGPVPGLYAQHAQNTKHTKHTNDGTHAVPGILRGPRLTQTPVLLPTSVPQAPRGKL